MGLVELMLMGVGLAMDAFAVSICKGLAMRARSTKSNVLSLRFSLADFRR